MIVTIHQPDFMPWMGFFNKIAKSDIWVLLDHVENNPRDAGFWGRRVRVLVNGSPAWLSIPLKKPDQTGVVGVPINQMKINTELQKNLSKSFRTLHQAYSGTPYYKEYCYLIDDFFLDDDPSLINRNVKFILEILKILGINTEVVPSSKFGFESKKNELLIDLIKVVHGNTYLCGQGAQGYQDDSKFLSEGIALEYNRFEHPNYTQRHTKECVHGLSIIDALFNMPVEKVSSMIVPAL
ncbi:WbqC family protein [Pseudomonadales bacterium]|nr:WbqC family protein [Pseudomonadales bacterium]